MIHAYDKCYLAAAQKTLARMLDYLTNSLKYPIEKAWQLFLMSEMSTRFEQGDCSVTVGMSGIELAIKVLEQADEQVPTSTPSFAYERSPEYWTGWAVAYYQWDTSLTFSDIDKVVPIADICRMYNPYHEMDIRQFVDKMNELYRAAVPDTNLKRLRILSSMSQAELAEQSGISKRTIQQYEQRQKDINKAQSETLLKLSRALNCQMEELLEKVPMK